jgi:hypothetical protein
MIIKNLYIYIYIYICKSVGIYKIPADLTKVGGREIHSEIHKHIYSIWHLEELPEQWKVSVFVPIYKKCDEIDSSNY